MSVIMSEEIEEIPLASSETSYNDAEKNDIFNREFMPHINSMYNFAFRLTNDEDDANDLVQDTYMKAFRFINSFQEGTNAKAWLFKILKNTFINDYRRKSRGPAMKELDEVIAYQNRENTPYSSAPAGLAVESYESAMGDEVTMAINKLSMNFREVLLLSDVEDFSYEEISKILDIPIGTVRSRLNRARNAVKEDLQLYAQSMGFKDNR